MTTPQKGRIFISYRRTDSAGYAGRIFDRLSAHFGAEAVFMDVDTIEAGLDFVEVLQNAVQSCDVLVALIGRQWLNVTDGTGNRRIDNPEDFVRIEIAAALERNVRVIPVLVDGVSMPYSTELPENLKSLARRNALQVDHHSFNADANRLISQLELALKAAEFSKIEDERKKREAHERHATEDRRKKEIAEEAAQKERVEKTRRERIAQEKQVAEEKARKGALRKARLQETAEGIKIIFRKGNRLPIFIGGGIVALFFLGYIIKNVVVPSTPSPPTTDVPQELGVGSTMVSDKDGMVMVYVPAGEFQMGSENGKDDEKPVHPVYLDAFWIDQTEITNAIYGNCVQVGECNQPSNTTYYNDTSYADHPVIYVSWFDAVAYCKWAGRSLPSEAEWEKAAGWDENAQTQRMYPWGNAFDGTKTNFCDANCSYASKNADFDDGYAFTAPVGSYPDGKSFYGALDMAGNVWEWVSDWYDVYPGGDKNASNDFGQPNRVSRGGSWDNDDSSYVRSATRNWDAPAFSYFTIGFRCARNASP